MSLEAIGLALPQAETLSAMTVIVRTPEGFEIVPPTWAADRPATSTAAVRSWAELADFCEVQATWCGMVLETRQIEPHARELVRIEHGHMIEAVVAYRHWAALRRPFRGKVAP